MNNINWQEIYYITSSLAMGLIFLFGLAGIFLLYKIYEIFKNIEKTTQQGRQLINDIRYFRKDFKVSILKFLLRLVEKGENNEK